MRSDQHRHAVLVVDDYADLRDGILTYLDILGFATREAASGPEALAMLAEGYRPCVILLDLWMPGMDGWEVCDAIRSSRDTADIPVVILSGDNSVVLGEIDGVDGTLAKPCTPDDVAAAVTAYARCGSRRTHRAARSANDRHWFVGHTDRP